MSLKNIDYLKKHYEKYPYKLVEDYIGIKLPWYQKVLIELSNIKVYK